MQKTVSMYLVSDRALPRSSLLPFRYRLNDDWNNHRRRQRLGGIMILDHGDNGPKRNYNYSSSMYNNCIITSYIFLNEIYNIKY